MRREYRMGFYNVNKIVFFLCQFQFANSILAFRNFLFVLPKKYDGQYNDCEGCFVKKKIVIRPLLRFSYLYSIYLRYFIV